MRRPARKSSGALSEANPEPRSDLEYRDPYTLLVAVVLSAQATDTGVNKATRRLFAQADTPEAMLGSGEDAVRELIRTIGLYRAKAKNVNRACLRILVEQTLRRRPSLTARRWRPCPAWGKKTAAVVVKSSPSGEPTIAVDTHIFRVSHRIPLAIARTADAMEAALTPIVARRLSPPRPSLADPARALCVQGAQARLPALPESAICAATPPTRRRRSATPESEAVADLVGPENAPAG